MPNKRPIKLLKPHDLFVFVFILRFSLLPFLFFCQTLFFSWSIHLYMFQNHFRVLDVSEWCQILGPCWNYASAVHARSLLARLDWTSPVAKTAARGKVQLGRQLLCYLLTSLQLLLLLLLLLIPPTPPQPPPPQPLQLVAVAACSATANNTSSSTSNSSSSCSISSSSIVRSVMGRAYQSSQRSSNSNRCAPVQRSQLAPQTLDRGVYLRHTVRLLRSGLLPHECSCTPINTFGNRARPTTPTEPTPVHILWSWSRCTGKAEAESETLGRRPSTSENSKC